MKPILTAIAVCAVLHVGVPVSAQESYEERAAAVPDVLPNEAFCKKPYPNCVPIHHLPCLCLQSVYGAGDSPDQRRPSGAFTIKRLVSGKGVFTWKGKCYTAQMRYRGQDEKYWYYHALCTPYCFAIAKDADPYYKDHRMWIYTPHSGGFVFYQYAAPYDCPAVVPSATSHCGYVRTHTCSYPCYTRCCYPRRRCCLRR